MLATMTMLVVMRVLLVVRDGVEFEAGRRGRCGDYTARGSTYAWLRSCSICYICTVCTVLYISFDVRTVRCSAVEDWSPTQHHHHHVPKNRRGSSEVKFLGGWMVVVGGCGLAWERAGVRKHALIGPQRIFSFSKAMGWVVGCAICG